MMWIGQPTNLKNISSPTTNFLVFLYHLRQDSLFCLLSRRLRASLLIFSAPCIQMKSFFQSLFAQVLYKIVFIRKFHKYVGLFFYFALQVDTSTTLGNLLINKSYVNVESSIRNANTLLFSMSIFSFFEDFQKW